MGRASTVRFILLALMWGSSFLFIRVALEGLAPLQIVLARVCVGAAVLLGFVGVRRLALPRSPSLWGHFFVAAALVVVPYFLFAWAEQTVPSSVAGALNATTPLFTAGLVVLAGQESGRHRHRMAGLAVGFVGAVVVLAPWRAGSALGSTAGQVACLAAAATYALGYLYISRYLSREGLPALVLSACQLLAAVVILLALLPFWATAPVALTSRVVLSIVALGALGTGFAYILNYRLITDEGPTTASAVTYVLPVVSVALGVIVLSEPLAWNLVVGGLLVLAGVALSQDRLRSVGRTYSRSPGERVR